MAYKFIKTADPTNPHDIVNVTMELIHNEADIPTMLITFEEFLKACGFHFEPGSLIMKEDNDG